jgi:endogenous inhibitor of DNA gyrase (YacG/DUF329 family)
MIKHSERPLWQCPRCQRSFANRNQSHFCGQHDLATHFRGKPAEIRVIFEAVLRTIRRFGPVTVLPEKTRIAFQVRMSFAQVTPRVHWVDGHVVLARRLEHPRFRRIDTISRRNHVHHFRLTTVSDVDMEAEAWLSEAYAVGQQRHLKAAAQPQHLGDGSPDRKKRRKAEAASPRRRGATEK